MRICNLRVCIYKFQNHSANLYMRIVKKVVISLNSLKMEDQRVCFHKKFEKIPDYKILFFESLLYSQWRHQCFVCFRQLFVSLWTNFYFWKIKWLAGGIEYLTEILETIVMVVYIDCAKFCLFSQANLSVQVILPYDRTTKTSSSFLGLPQLTWHF